MATRRADAEKIDAVRRAARAGPGRDFTVLVETASEGKTVGRLKWGEAYVFESGGKEARVPAEQPIPSRLSRHPGTSASGSMRHTGDVPGAATSSR